MTHVALLRGINVGRAKRIAMADLRALVAKLGYGNVRTLLNSGNVVFDVPSSRRGDPAARLEEAMTNALGVSARVTVLSAADLAKVVAKNPFATVATDPARYLVGFLKEPGHAKRLAVLAGKSWKPEALAVGPGVVYLWCAGGILESAILSSASRLLGDAITTRNWTTVTKLLALASEVPAAGE